LGREKGGQNGRKKEKYNGQETIEQGAGGKSSEGQSPWAEIRRSRGPAEKEKGMVRKTVRNTQNKLNNRGRKTQFLTD